MNNEPTYEVVAPAQEAPEEGISTNERPSSLSNKTIGFVWDYLFEGPVFFDAVRRLVDREFSDVRYIDYDTFGNISWIDAEQLPELAERVRTAGVDIAVVEVGA